MPIVLPGIVSNLQQLIKVPGAITLRRTSQSSSNTTSFAAALPVGIQDGNILVAVAGNSHNGNASASTANSDGMTEIQQNNHNGTLGSFNAAVFWKEYDSAGGDPTDNFTFTSAQSRSWTVHLMVISGLSDVDPKDGSTFVDTNTTPVNLPTMTPGVAPTLGLELFCVRSNSTDTSTVSSTPSGSIEELNITNWTHGDADGRHRLYIATKDWLTTDPTGTRAYGLTDLAVSTVQRCAGVHVLLKG